MRTVIDQLGRTIQAPDFPVRIVSLVPSQTELLHALGLGERMVGITKFCIHPEDWYRTKPRVGGTKTVDFSKVAALAPDLILGNREENDRQQIEALAASFPVWMSDIFTLDDALAMIRGIGDLTQTAPRAHALAETIAERFAGMPVWEKRRRAAYFIWYKPLMAAGGQTFIDDMMRRAGFNNVFGDRARYPEISEEALIGAAPEVILLSSEPFPFSEKHIDYFKRVVPQAQVKLVDGEMFSWYGSRLLEAPGYFSWLG